MPDGLESTRMLPGEASAQIPAIEVAVNVVNRRRAAERRRQRRVGWALALSGLAVAYVVDTSGWIRINPAVYFIDHLPVHIEPFDVLVVVGASIAIAVLATVYPSRTAAGLTPVEAIRHE